MQSSMRTNEFTAFLKEKGYAASTIKNLCLMLLSFETWLEKEKMEAEEVRYNDIVAYMKHLQQRGVSQITLDRYVRTVRLYYKILMAKDMVVNNPAGFIKVQGIKRKTVYRILEPHELGALYGEFTANSDKDKRDKVLLGLLVYQGLSSTDLSKIEVKHVLLREGKIEIPGGKRTGGRTLELEPPQVLDLFEYVMQVRPQLLKASGEITDRLLVNMLGSKTINNMVGRLCSLLRQSGVKNAPQIRTSVITKWLKGYNIRQVQYMAGHRYISSTESYLQNDMEGLSEEVSQFHPMG